MSDFFQDFVGAVLPDMAHLVAELPGMTSEEAQVCYAQLGIFFTPDGILDLGKTVFTVARNMSRLNTETPQIALENPVVAATWRGSQTFTAAEIEAALFHYDIQVELGDIKRWLAKFVSRKQMVRFPDGRIQFRMFE